MPGEPSVTSESPVGAAWPILGQEQAVGLLQWAIAHGSVAHAYLFTGPPHSGRSTLARLFAQTLNCETPEAAGSALAPCGECRSCRKIARGVHPDVQVVGRASQEAGAGAGRKESKHTTLSIDTIRELQAGLSLRPLESRWKVAIVADAETMQEAAANAFLKTLEEPPPFAILIVVAPDAGAVLPTIRSRCQLVELRPTPREILSRALTARYGASPSDAQTLAALSRGRAGWAIAAVERPTFLAERRAALDGMLGLLRGPTFDLFGLVDRLTERFRQGKRDEVYAELDTWLGLWRDLLLVRSGCGELALNVDYGAAFGALAGRYELTELAGAVEATRTASRQLDQNVAPRLALEAMVSRWLAVHGRRVSAGDAEG